MEKVARQETERQVSRWWPLGVVAVAFLLLGFYAATDPARLTHSRVLDGADLAGYALCHRITEHSFTVAGRQLPLCARCTGMYLGIMLTFAVLIPAGRGRWTALPPLPMMVVLAGLVGLMGVDGLNSYSHFFENAPHLYEPRNWLRLLTGMGTGLTMGVFVFPVLAQTLWRRSVYRPVLGSWMEFGGLLLLAGLLVLLVLSNQPALLYVLALVSAAGVVVILTSLNSVILLILLRREARAEKWREIVGPLLVGLALAMVQIGLVSFARYSLTGTLTGFPGL